MNDYRFTETYIDDIELSNATSDALRRVYNWMGIGLLLTAVVAWFSQSLMIQILNVPYLILGIFAVELGLVWWLSRNIMRLDPTTALLGFFGYAALNGVTMAFVFLAYELGSVVLTFGVTTALFFVMSMIGYTTKVDLSGWGSYLMMGLIGFIIASVANFFFQNELFYWIITYAGIAIFIGLTVYNTQQIKRMTQAALITGDDDMVRRVGVRGALSLYLDFINLFLLLLRILGRRR